MLAGHETTVPRMFELAGQPFSEDGTAGRRNRRAVAICAHRTNPGEIGRVLRPSIHSAICSRLNR